MTIKCLRIGRALLEFDIERGRLQINNVGYKNDVIYIKDDPVVSFTTGTSIDDPTHYTFSVKGHPNVHVSDTCEVNDNADKILTKINKNFAAMFAATC